MKTPLAAKLPQDFRNELERLIDSNNAMRADGRPASTKTQLERASIIRLALAQLYEMGYRLRRPDALGERHVRALIERWEVEQLVANTLHTRISVLSLFATWIGKRGMVRSPADYLGDRARRTQVATANKAWQAKGVEPDALIEDARKLDERMALYLALMHEFGLRQKEALQFRPATAIVEEGRLLHVHDGTKGGRSRFVPIETDGQREVLAWARELSHGKHGSIRWPGHTWAEAKRRFYHLAGKLGMTKAQLGVTGHGLRHGYAQDRYKRKAGQPTPIEGADPRVIDRVTHRQASQEVSLELGHIRLGITGAYYGSHGHRLRASGPRTPWGNAANERATYSYAGNSMRVAA
jgi:integrase